jgi:uncharacterized membrane protein YgdD (TMEM256/DUF423 family)
MPKLFIVLGAASAFAGVALGAFAAHLLKDKLAPDLFQIFEVAVRYQMYHALGMIAVGLLLTVYPEVNLTPAGWLFTAGTILFSGSLYILSLTGVRWLGAVTPLGGICFLAGWCWIGWGFLRS